MNDLYRLGDTLCVHTIPGWTGSDARHWQARWEQRYGWQRVQQHDWLRPLRGDWMAQLETAVLQADKPVVLIAHDLGCTLVAAWAAHSRHAHKVHAALLVAPSDTERGMLAEVLRGWRPIERQRLPFASMLAVSRDDTFCAFDRAAQLAADWGSILVDAGHGNADSKPGEWETGLQLLQQLLCNAQKAPKHTSRQTSK